MTVASRFTISGFGDEIAPDPDEQLTVMDRLEIKHLDLRRAWGKGVLDLDETEVRNLQAVLAKHGSRVSMIASPIGKTEIDQDPAPEHARLDTAIRLADAFETRFIRLFSYYHTNVDLAACRDEVLRRLSQQAKRAEQAGVTLLLENEQRLWGDTPERCLDLVQSVGSPNLRLSFDTGNFAMIGVPAYDVAYPMLRPHLIHIQIKDVRTAQRDHTVAGKGDGQIPEVLAALYRDGYEGFLSLEPHLALAERASGFSGEGRFVEASEALRGLLAAIDGAAA